jgi:hypothetical protein
MGAVLPSSAGAVHGALNRPTAFYCEARELVSSRSQIQDSFSFRGLSTPCSLQPSSDWLRPCRSANARSPVQAQAATHFRLDFDVLFHTQPLPTDSVVNLHPGRAPLRVRLLLQVTLTPAKTAYPSSIAHVVALSPSAHPPRRARGRRDRSTSARFQRWARSSVAGISDLPELFGPSNLLFKEPETRPLTATPSRARSSSPTHSPTPKSLRASRRRCPSLEQATHPLCPSPIWRQGSRPSMTARDLARVTIQRAARESLSLLRRDCLGFQFGSLNRTKLIRSTTTACSEERAVVGRTSQLAIRHRVVFAPSPLLGDSDPKAIANLGESSSLRPQVRPASTPRGQPPPEQRYPWLSPEGPDPLNLLLLN